VKVTDMWRHIRWSADAMKCSRRGVGKVDEAEGGGRTSGHANKCETKRAHN